MTEHEHEHRHGFQQDGSPPWWVGVEVDAIFTQAFWDERYSDFDQVWSGKVNPTLATNAGGLPAGTALDVGCGEGADAIWLASQGWTVTGADVSPVALARAAAQAKQQGQEVTWQQADLFSWIPPESSFDLVTAHFVHLSRPALGILHQRLGAAVRPGGSLLLVGHHPDDADPDEPAEFAAMRFTPDEVMAVLDPEQWRTVVAATAERSVQVHGHRRDVVVHAVRR